jgi:hypothetical protein
MVGFRGEEGSGAFREGTGVMYDRAKWMIVLNGKTLAFVRYATFIRGKCGILQEAVSNVWYGLGSSFLIHRGLALSSPG